MLCQQKNNANGVFLHLWSGPCLFTKDVYIFHSETQRALQSYV